MANILVVDDDADTCRNMADLFGDRGHRVDAVESGDTALDFANRRPYDIGLLDLRMPGMDGLTLCRRLCELRPTMVKMIITGNPAEGLDDEAHAAGARRVVSKPLDVARLLALVEQALRSSGPAAWQ